MIRVWILGIDLDIPDHHSVLTTTAFTVRKRFSVKEQTDICLKIVVNSLLLKAKQLQYPKVIVLR